MFLCKVRDVLFEVLEVVYEMMEGQVLGVGVRKGFERWRKVWGMDGDFFGEVFGEYDGKQEAGFFEEGEVLNNDEV